MCMDEIWEKAVETALDGVTDSSSARTLTLDGAVKCLHGRLPPPNLLEKFSNLQHLSIANIGLSSLEQFPRLRNLEKLILSDNRIAGGLEFLVLAGLDSLRDLDLSNNRIQFIEDLAPLAELKLASLDLYECPITRVKDYRVRVFGLIKSLKYLDKMDLEDNERPESDDDDDDDVSEDDEEEDPGSGEIDGEDRQFRLSNGHSSGGEGIVDVDEDEESDADEEETEDRDPMRVTQSNGSNGFRVSVWGLGSVGEEEGAEDEDNDEEDESVEEIDEDDGEDEDVVEVHDVGDSDDEDDDDDDGEEFEEDDEDDDEDDEVDNVNNDDGDVAELESMGKLTSLDGEIDGHEQGEEDDEDDNGETGGEELGNDDEVYSDEDNDDGDDEEEDGEEGYLVQRVGGSAGDVEDSDMEPGNDDGEEVEDDDDDLGEGQVMAPSSSSQPKRKRDDDTDVDDEDHANGGRPSSKKHL